MILSHTHLAQRVLKDRLNFAPSERGVQISVDLTETAGRAVQIFAP
ncbi:hypothetical protein DFAR_1540017 [Desulfarculales bacterium]